MPFQLLNRTKNVLSHCCHLVPIRQKTEKSFAEAGMTCGFFGDGEKFDAEAFVIQQIG